MTDKRILAVGRIHPPNDGIRLKFMEYPDNELPYHVWYDVTNILEEPKDE